MDESTTSDAELLEAYLKGDTKAFQVLENRYRKALFAWLMSSLNSKADAEDLYQDVWIKIIRKAGSSYNFV